MKCNMNWRGGNLLKDYFMLPKQTNKMIHFITSADKAKLLIKQRRCVFFESQPVTAEWAAASSSSGFTICCFDLTGRYWIWPSWLTAIWQEEKETGNNEVSSKQKHSPLEPEMFNISFYLLLHQSTFMLVLDNMSIGHLRNRGEKSVSAFWSEGWHHFLKGWTPTCIWLPSATTTYSCGISCGTPSCEMIYWT